MEIRFLILSYLCGEIFGKYYSYNLIYLKYYFHIAIVET